MTKKVFYRCCIILVLAHLFILGIYGTRKQGFHEDEYYSYWSSTGKVALEPRSVFDVRTGYEIQRQFTVRSGERFRFSEVIQNQEEDVHPPLYYLVLNVVMSLLPEHFYKWFGLSLNMLCSCVILWSVLFMLYSLGGQKYHAWAALSAGLVYILAPSTISNVMLTRMYTMSAMWTVLYAFLMARVVRDEGCGRKRFAIYTALGTLLCFLAFMTHYFCLLVPFFLTLCYCVSSLVTRKGTGRMFLYGICMCCGVALAVCLYPASLEHIFHGYRGEGAISSLIGANFKELSAMFLNVLDESVFSGMMRPVLLLSAAAFLFCCLKRGRDKMVVYCMASMHISCIATVCFLIKTSLFLGDVSCRYFYPVLALFLPLQAYFLCRAAVELTLGKRGRRIICIAAVLLICTPFLAGHIQKKVLFLYPENAERKEDARCYAAKHYPLIVVYSRKTRYYSWFIADQVWPFEYVIYSDYDHIIEPPENPLLTESKGFLVYMDAPAETLDALTAANPHVSGYTLQNEGRFFDIYLLE